MDQQICDWLGLPTAIWPPDHYVLLGINPGESDPRLIEERVQERMRRVRPFQLNYPDQVTEAMNRLAQAFSCLTDPVVRKAYDEFLQASAPGQITQDFTEENGSIAPNAPLAWLFGPWDRLADVESPSPNTQPQFQQWTATVQPPRQRKKVGSKGGKKMETFTSPKKIPKEESNGQNSKTSLGWKYSNSLVFLLAFLALLIAVWRQLGR